MATYNEQLQAIWHEYVESSQSLATPREVVTWAIQNGKLEKPKIDPVSALAEEMARALRDEYRTDAKGRRYRLNHAVRITRDGVQTTLWGDINSSPREHMVKAFAQRRNQIVGDCIQLRTDVDVFNGKHPGAAPIQLVLNFAADVEEALGLRDVA